MEARLEKIKSIIKYLSLGSGEACAPRGGFLISMVFKLALTGVVILDATGYIFLFATGLINDAEFDPLGLLV
jgi:hypothetical protein